MRLVIVRTVDRDGKATELWLITDRLDLDADLVALAYRYRWTVETCQADSTSSDRWCGTPGAGYDRRRRAA